MRDSYELFKKEAHELISLHPKLNYYQDDTGTPSVSGYIDLEDEHVGLIDSYQIIITCTPLYPKRFPYVFEKEGRIPINVDWHVHKDGHCCICSIPDEVIVCQGGITLSSFYEEQVKPYFFNQKHREVHGYFLKERSHGKGNFEFFVDLFKTEDAVLIKQWLNYIKDNNEPNRVQKCFCGSEIKFRKCHRNAFRLIKALPIDEIENFIQLV